MAKHSEDLRIVSSNDEPAASPASAVARYERQNVAIDISNASLKYPIGPYVRGSLKANLMGMFSRKQEQVNSQYVYALQDLDLSISLGERVGLIGGNGSGKSSLLRAMAGIYPLEKGSIRVDGQIGTLLDVSLGFEPESTGRENIYYRGMAMGFSRKRLREVEQEIIDFAELGDFIDLPMRTYSAGMHVRLGFAVSTQFTPDVLLIDEVFGAGDAQFAQKALARMTHIVNNAGIMIIATHDLGLVEKICTRVLWVHNSQIVRDGPPLAVVPQYRQFVAGQLSP